MSNQERFYLRNVELRAIGNEDDDDEFALEGYAASWDSEADLGDFHERCTPSAFTRALREGQDVRCLRNHDPNFVLGRTKNRTLQLRCDDKGLRFRCQLDRNNPEHRATHSMVRRGDMDGCSFAFRVVPGGQRWSDQRAADGSVYALRELLDVDLQDVSAVTFPAYQAGTEVNARSLFMPEGESVEVRSAVERFKKAHPEEADAPTAEELRLQLLKVKLF
jgi:HK97 family phage prohead protease